MEDIKKEFSINLCELVKQLNTYDVSMDELIKGCEREQKLAPVTRIYFGSYFCSHYFLHMTQEEYEKLIVYATNHGIKLTLVLPIFTEKSLTKAKRRIESLCRYFSTIIDEVTVNDYGMLNYIHSVYSVKINLGRLFMKDYRDPRYDEYFSGPFKPRGFTSFLKEIVNTYKIHMIEFDPTHESIDFSEKPEKVLIGLHSPYCYMTTGQICEYSSVNKEIEQKFRPNTECTLECVSHHIEYELEEMNGERKFIRFGRTIYFENNNCKVTGLTSMRVIYFPLDREAARYG